MPAIMTTLRPESAKVNIVKNVTLNVRFFQAPLCAHRALMI